MFVFGDNILRRGTGGQAKACRGKLNTICIITKKYPSNYVGSFYFEKDYDQWLKDSASGFCSVEHELKKGSIVVWPKEGIGTGLAELPKYAPSIYEYIEKFLERMKETYGENTTP